MWREYAPDRRMRLNLGIRRRLAPLLDNDRRETELAHSLLLTLPGSPILYYGDEIGMGDYILLKDRDGVRTPMQWNDTPNAGFSAAAPSQLYARVIDDAEFGYRRVNVAAQQRAPASLWHAIRKMIAARRRQRAFGRGTCEFVPLENQAVLAYLRRFEHETVLVANNLSASPQVISLDLTGLARRGITDLIAQTPFAHSMAAPHSITLAPYQFLWLG